MHHGAGAGLTAVAVYVPDNVVDRTFLQRTRRLLKSLARLAGELEDTIHNRLQGPTQVDLSSVALLTLAYHEVRTLFANSGLTLAHHILQCAILATRPILLSLLKRNISNRPLRQRSMQQNLGTLVETCANSAAKVIDLLTVRLDNNMIGKDSGGLSRMCADILRRGLLTLPTRDTFLGPSCTIDDTYPILHRDQCLHIGGKGACHL